jgi:quinol monooxygenase YgiN
MSSEISWLLEVAIHPGQEGNFRGVANDLIASTKSEPGVLAYEWNLNEDGTVCHIYESYRDSAAIQSHHQSFATFAERFMQACRPTRFNVYGAPSDEVKAGLAGLNPVYFSLLGGFSR